MRATIVLIPLIALAFAASARAQKCTPSHLTLQSDTVGGQVILVANGRTRPGTNAYIDMLEFRGGNWESIGKIFAIDHGYFTWLDVAPGNYVLVATLQGYLETRISVDVKQRHGREAKIIVPLKTDGCAHALRRKGR
jgi:hypothetical protein